jgi:hypothetical protein
MFMDEQIAYLIAFIRYWQWLHSLVSHERHKKVAHDNRIKTKRR